MDRILLHVDMDAFYAAVETRDRPELAHVPLVIGADPQGGAGRGVVCTANYPARRYGIHSAMPISRAYAACPHATYLRPDFAKYKAASRAVMAVLADYADRLEVVGLDEAYLDVTHAAGSWDRVPAFVRSLQAAVARATRLSCSVGAAPTRAVAKIASDRDKPHGATIVGPDAVEDFLAPLPVRLIPGCGPRTAERLAAHGIATIGDLAAASPDALGLGAHGRCLHAVARGADTRGVRPERAPRKSLGNERTFPRDERHPAFLRATARRLAEEAVADAQADGRAFATVTLKVRFADFTTFTRARTLPVPLSPREPDTARLVVAAVEHLLTPHLEGRPVRLLGVRLSGFAGAPAQRPLSRFGFSLLEAAPVAA